MTTAARSRRRSRSSLEVLAVFAVLAAAVVGPRIMTKAASAATSEFTVNSTGDDPDKVINGVCATKKGVCTLRAAIMEANARAGADLIRFAISGTGVHTIQLASELPALDDRSGGTTIDGYTQAGSSPNTDPLVDNAHIAIEVRGTGNQGVNGIEVFSGNNVLRGLAFYNLHRAIHLWGQASVGNVIAGCFIGTNAAGTFGFGGNSSSAHGIQLMAGANHNRTGGPNAADRNVLSGNASVAWITFDAGTDHNAVYNNIIGLNPSGTAALPNSYGIDINRSSSFNVIGGTGPGERNVISGNRGEAVEISHNPDTQGNQVVGNFLGTDVTGERATAATGNGTYGIQLQDAVHDNWFTDNVVGGNRAGGIHIDGTGTKANHFERNYVGVSPGGAAIPNRGYGVVISTHAQHNIVGPGNVIARNDKAGVAVVSQADTDYNTITRNSMYGNGGLGIDLPPLGGVTTNDAGDADSGPNEQLNFPEITGATTAQVAGRACAGCTVELFAAEPDANGYGEGRTFLAATVAASDGSFSLAPGGAAAGTTVTATATDPLGDTSEFSQNQVLTAVVTQTVVVSDTFGRTVASGWGSADTGQAYGLIGPATDFHVTPGAGSFVLGAPGTGRTVTVPVDESEVAIEMAVDADKAATGAGIYTSAIGRRTAAGEYRVTLRFLADGSVRLLPVRVASGAETALGPEVVVPGLTRVAGTAIHVRVEMTGSSPTTIRAKAWQDGTPQPATWPSTVTDSTAGFQGPGSAGVRAYVSGTATNTPVTVSLGSFQLFRLGP